MACATSGVGRVQRGVAKWWRSYLYIRNMEDELRCSNSDVLNLRKQTILTFNVPCFTVVCIFMEAFPSHPLFFLNQMTTRNSSDYQKTHLHKLVCLCHCKMFSSSSSRFCATESNIWTLSILLSKWINKYISLYENWVTSRQVCLGLCNKCHSVSLSVSSPWMCCFLAIWSGCLGKACKFCGEEIHTVSIVVLAEV